MVNLIDKDKAIVDFQKENIIKKNKNAAMFKCPICGGKAYWHTEKRFGTYAQCTRCGAESHA